MELIFSSRKKDILRSVNILLPFLKQLIKTEMYYRLPFKQNTNLEKINHQIKVDLKNFSSLSVKKNLEKKWDSKKKKIICDLGKFLKKEGVRLEKRYLCVVSLYGPYGFYETPNIIYVNVAEAEKKGIDFLFDTILHELLHLIFDEKIKDLPANQKEAFIDKTFKKIFWRYH